MHAERGAWSANTPYQTEHVVESGGVRYEAAAWHTSSSSFAADLAAGLWVALDGGLGTAAGMTPAQIAADPAFTGTYGRTGKAFEGLKGLLTAGYTASIGVIGDSTGVGTTRWPYLIGQQLAAAYPNYTVQWRPYDTGTASYDIAPTVIQTGTAGARSVTFDGVTTAALQTAATSANNITGNIDLRAKIQPTSWIPGSGNNRTIIAKFGAGGSRCYRFQITPAGLLYLDWTPDGSTLTGYVASSTAVPFSNGNPGWVRAVLNVNNGGNWQVIFYTSTDGATWTQLGTVTNGTGTTSIFSTTTQPIEFGARSGGQAEMFPGAIFTAEVHNGINGPNTCPVWPDQWVVSNSAFNGAFSGAPILDIWNGSWTGASIGTALLANVASLVPAVGLCLVVVNDSKNEASGVSDFAVLLDSLMTPIMAQNPGAGIAVTCQNPDISPAPQYIIDNTARRTASIPAYAARREYSVIPVYNAFRTSALGLAALTNSDGIHPSDAAGSPLWANTVMAQFNAAAVAV